VKRDSQRRYSLDEYFAVEETSQVKNEYYDDGEIFAMAGASLEHNRIAAYAKGPNVAFFSTRPITDLLATKKDRGMILIRKLREHALETTFTLMHRAAMKSRFSPFRNRRINGGPRFPRPAAIGHAGAPMERNCFTGRQTDG